MISNSISSLPVLQVPGCSMLWREVIEDWQLEPLSQKLAVNRSSLLRLTQKKAKTSGLSNSCLYFSLCDDEKILGFTVFHFYPGKTNKAVLTNIYQEKAQGFEAALPTIIAALTIQFTLGSLLITNSDGSSVKTLEPHQKKELLVFDNCKPDVSARRYQSLHLEAQLWFKANQNEEFAKNLRYLQIRKIRRGRVSKSPNSRRPFLARLFRPKIDDSLL